MPVVRQTAAESAQATGRRRPSFHTLTVKEVRRLTEDAIEVTFAVPAKLAGHFDYLPGQYVALRTTLPDENGEPLYLVQLIAMTDGAAEILAVKVPGMPSGLRQGHPVKVTGLVAQPWTMNDRAGVAFRAARVEPVVAQAKAS